MEKIEPGATQEFTEGGLRRFAVFMMIVMQVLFWGFVGERAMALQNPVPDVKANGSDSQIIVSSSDSVTITVSLSPGDQAGQTAEWWIYADTSSGSFSWVYPSGWQYGEYRTIEYPLFDLPANTVLDMSLPAGEYRFYFSVDNKPDNLKDSMWLDAVSVMVSDRNDSADNPGPDPEYDNITWTLPTTASDLRLSLPADIDDFLFDEHGGIGHGFGNHVASAEYTLIDHGRTDGVMTDDPINPGSLVSPFDYLNEEDKRILVDRYKRKNIKIPAKKSGVFKNINRI